MQNAEEDGPEDLTLPGKGRGKWILVEGGGSNNDSESYGLIGEEEHGAGNVEIFPPNPVTIISHRQPAFFLMKW